MGARAEFLSHHFPPWGRPTNFLTTTRPKIAGLEPSCGHHGGEIGDFNRTHMVNKSRRHRGGRREGWVDAGLCSRRGCLLGWKQNSPNVAARKSLHALPGASRSNTSFPPTSKGRRQSPQGVFHSRQLKIAGIGWSKSFLLFVMHRHSPDGLGRNESILLPGPRARGVLP